MPHILQISPNEWLVPTARARIVQTSGHFSVTATITLAEIDGIFRATTATLPAALAVCEELSNFYIGD